MPGMSRYLTTLAHLSHSSPKCDFIIASSRAILSRRLVSVAISSTTHISTSSLIAGTVSKIPEALSHDVCDPYKIDRPMTCM